MTAPFSFTAFIITDDSPNENTLLIPSGQLFVILAVLFFKYRRPHILCSDDLQPQVEGLCLILEAKVTNGILLRALSNGRLLV